MRSLLKPLNMLKRGFMQSIDRDYTKKKLMKRKGNCKKCGKCCKGCRYLGKDNLCKIYNKRPLLCFKDFPLDKFDLWIWNVKDCGYSFD